MRVFDSPEPCGSFPFPCPEYLRSVIMSLPLLIYCVTMRSIYVSCCQSF